MSSNLSKLQLERNKFIRELSKEQFDIVITNKYKKVFFDYFNGVINDDILNKKIESNLELINIYGNGDTGKIDTNQYLYSAIVDVALHYYNVAGGFETCINKMELLTSFFQLIASAESKLVHLEDLIYDVFFINYNFDDDEYLEKKLMMLSSVANSLDNLIIEIEKHQDVIIDVEKSSKHSFIDEMHISGGIKEMYGIFIDSFRSINDKFKELKSECFNESTGVKLDVMNGEFI